MTTQENRRSKITRRVFRESLTELMLEKGMQKSSVIEICKRADMNRSTFYAHYEDQFDLLREIEDEFLIALRKTVTESNLQNFTQKFEKYLDYLYQSGRLFTLLMNEAPGFRDRIVKEAFSLYAMRKESGLSLRRTHASRKSSISFPGAVFCFWKNGSKETVRSPRRKWRI